MNDPRPTGPSLTLLGVACLSLLFGGIGIGVAVGGVMPLPYGSLTPIQAYVRTNPVAVRILATAAFASSVPLALYAAAAGDRLRRLGVSGPAATIAAVGGALAAGALGLTGLLGWTLSWSEVAADAALVRAIYLMVFLVGGPGHIVALGLLVAGIAVPSLAMGLMARPVAWIGLAICALAESAALVLVWPQCGPILPVARLFGLIWLVAGGALLPRGDLDPKQVVA